MYERKDRLYRRAKAEGFDDLRINPATGNPRDGENLRAFVDAGHHGDMGWIAETMARRQSPNAMWPEARTAIMLAMSYGPAR